MSNHVYLRPDVYFEPLFNKWFMWPYLMSPATAAMNLVNQHMRSMKSFVANAKIHAKSVKAKSMTGSSLMNLPLSQVDDVKQLVAKSRDQYGDLFELVDAICELDKMLLSEAKGMSLEPLYEKIPDPLRGLVELCYDLNNQPSFRLIESLFYKTSYYKECAQSVCLGRLHSSERKFVLSTPRFADDDHLHLNIPLNHPFVNTLFSMRDVPQELDDIAAQFEALDIEGSLSFEELFTTTPPKKTAKPVEQGKVEIDYLGHAGLMVRTASATVMVDPVLAYMNDEEVNKVTFDDLPDSIDCVMVTHTHMDHLCIETLLQLKHKIKQIAVPKSNSGMLADPSMKLMLNALGFSNVVEVEDLDTFDHEDITITAMPFLGEHADVNIRSKSAWLIESKGKKIMAAADSSNIDPYLYKRLNDLYGDVDVLFIGMECTGGPLRWLYGALLTSPVSSEVNESRRFNGSDYKAASSIAAAFNAKSVYVYALGIEPWFGYFMGISYNEDDEQLVQSKMLVDECHSKGIPAKQLQGREHWVFS
ncbi:MBL fold metallo-hydrolase [Pseudoalteromonas luteoviolacea]|uniref:Putative Zn-dependent hydrolase n=1 Tax=Pseudoalteromonas luteoviolacea (strain 2ta16) TaxID=1353533 RepID=V4HSZ2_PSEL2|nr:MBL fold metallo-hydrolase [Pseudoalteromonas luteoviolacea]ESP93925.1 putative Zn-dependent hydrolase [Pseudoalteromonas luteoviolacea 2ta16]KZN31357.1 hypothetical protein N483_05915 [Pseudoalteromonas luteoviolacea NCIMB 1944]